MATADGFVKRADKNFIKTSTEFENSFKTRLSWSKKQWISSGENSTRLNKLANSINYWKNKLKPALEDNSIVFTVYNEDKDVKTDLLKIIESIESLDENVKVKGFSDFRNPRYMCIYLKDKEDRDFVIKNFRILEDSFIVYLHWAFEDSANILTVKVHWLPMSFDIDTIEKALQNYVKCVENERYEMSFMSGRSMPSGKVVFKASVREGVLIENIPHLMNINNMEALITVSGRLPLCLNCDQLGHVSKKCKMRFCPVCNGMKLKEHECTTSNKVTYASKVRGATVSRIRADADDQDAAIITNKLSQENKKKDLLSDTIAVLEKKVSESNGALLPIAFLERDSLLHEEKKKLASFWSSEQSPEVEADSEDMEDGLVLSSMEDDVDEEECSSVLAADSLEMDLGKQSQGKCKKSNNKGKNQVSKIKTKSSTLPKKVGDIDYNMFEGRSYGRPVLDNLRRKKEDLRFEKAMQKPEFIFRDVDVLK